MKKVISLLLALLLTFGLFACSKEEESAAVNPILGVWEVKSPDTEASFSFTETEEVTEGSYKYYDYSEESWGEFAFTVKEQTDNRIVLLIEDGTMEEMFYTIVGDRLYLNGIVYTNSNVTAPVLSSITGFSLLQNGQNYSVYDDLFLGMYIDDVESALGEKLDLESGTTRKEYHYFFTCNYHASILKSGQDYYALNLGFDDSNRLVHLSKQRRYDSSVFDSLLDSLTNDFGSPKLSSRTSDFGSYETFTWELENYVITLESLTQSGESVPNSIIVTYYYVP